MAASKKSIVKTRREAQTESAAHFIQSLLEFLRGDDRSVAIIGAALVEDALEKTLRLHLKVDDATAETVERLFKPDGPLGTFSTKIDMLFAFGVIGPVSYGNLQRIRDIRNKFAHKILMLDRKQKVSGMSFDAQQIADKCGAFREIEGRMWDKDGSAKKKYSLACIVITAALVEFLYKDTKPATAAQLLP